METKVHCSNEFDFKLYDICIVSTKEYRVKPPEVEVM